MVATASGAHHRHGPVVFGDAAPEHPGHHDREEGEKGFEEGAVDLSPGGIAEMGAHDKVEYLSDGEEDRCGGQVD